MKTHDIPSDTPNCLTPATLSEIMSAKPTARTKVHAARPIRNDLSCDGYSTYEEINRERDLLKSLITKSCMRIHALELDRAEMADALLDLLATPRTRHNEQQMNQARVALGLKPHAPKTL